MKAVLITGASSGLGKEFALLYSEKGYKIYAHGRSEEKLSSLKDQLHRDGGQVEIITADLTNVDQLQSIFSHISPDDKVEILINNAGVGHFGPLTSSSPKELEEMFSTNVMAPIHLTKEYITHVETGKIINIISTAGLRGKVNESLYSASKFALRGFAESMQKELATTNITVVNAYMGGMNTPFWEESHHVSDTSRFRSPKEVANYIFEQAESQTEIILESKK
ncbi:SDR family NAD(P)-dependent oxidoreductase [Bacillus sp. 2205SS5-2]|uniref:SDR family NAD(P)-dependent oxidoreductase n=1 Tax=Bacillus sp. 2205SS5-2 TaxID=3109031 RepID=UPI0030057877